MLRSRASGSLGSPNSRNACPSPRPSPSEPSPGSRSSSACRSAGSSCSAAGPGRAGDVRGRDPGVHLRRRPLERASRSSTTRCTRRQAPPRLGCLSDLAGRAARRRVHRRERGSRDPRAADAAARRADAADRRRRRAGGARARPRPTRSRSSSTPRGGGRFARGLTIAAAIGVHNFAEGLAIGVSARAGAISLATVLIIGFALHNATEGFGIVGPLGDVTPSLEVARARRADRRRPDVPRLDRRLRGHQPSARARVLRARGRRDPVRDRRGLERDAALRLSRARTADVSAPASWSAC